MKQETLSFVNFIKPEAGLIFDDSIHSKYPIKYYHVINGNGFIPEPDRSYYIFIYDGEATIKIEQGIQAFMPKDTYACHHGIFELCGLFKGVVIEVVSNSGIYKEQKYKAQTTIGGVVEEEGRLKYINGCTDSILIHPIKKGMPCLNHLHFPSNTTQTPHTHPSHRIGLVIRGKGECVTPFGNLPLETGCIFIIKEYDGVSKAKGLDGNIYEAGTHKFDTTSSSMDVIAFHPDSDFGAEDEFHPMINRTIVNGVSANQINDIKTK